MVKLILTITLAFYAATPIYFAWIDSEYEESIRRLETAIEHIETEIKINESNIRTIEEIESMRRDGILTAREYLDVCEKIGW